MKKLVLGVFEVQRSWKLYSDADGARTFADRGSALAAGERAARDAIASGRPVELHLQEPTGELRQADLRRLAH